MRPRWGIMMGKCTLWVVNSQRMGDNRLEIGVSEDLGVTWTWSFYR